MFYSDSDPFPYPKLHINVPQNKNLHISFLVIWSTLLHYLHSFSASAYNVFQIKETLKVFRISNCLLVHL